MTNCEGILVKHFYMTLVSVYFVSLLNLVPHFSLPTFILCMFTSPINMQLCVDINE